MLKCGSFSEFSSDAHVHNEFVADGLLRAAGCNVPASREYRADIGNGRVETLRLSEFIGNGRDLKPAFNEGTAAGKRFLIDQIVATYPVVSFIDGTDTYQHHCLDNVLVDGDYRLWFIDNGASFDFRARGARKNWFWSRTDPTDREHGFFAVRDYANESLKRILKNVSDDELIAAARKYDFVELYKTLPADYQQPALEEYAKNLNDWVNGKTITTGGKNMNSETLTAAECDYLEAASLLIAKAVRRVNRFIDANKPQQTYASKTMQNFRAGVDQTKLGELAKRDPSGRVVRLLGVCDDIANSEAAGFTVRVLAAKWQPKAPSTQRVGKTGNVDFADYAFDRRLVAVAAKPSAGAAPQGITVMKGDVSKIVADACVNAANSHLRAGSGICGAIFSRAGLAQLQSACDKVAPCPTGEVRVTPSFGMTNCKAIYHAVGPRYQDGRHGEPTLLANCYRNILKTAVANGHKSVAIPSISTGIYGYPLEDAAKIAVREVKAFLATNSGVEVIFVAWDEKTKALYEKLLK